MSLVRFRPEAPHADLAHLVERHLAKVEVAGSSPVIRSRKQKTRCNSIGFFVFSIGLRVALTRLEVARIQMGLLGATCLLDIWCEAPNMGSEPRTRTPHARRRATLMQGLRRIRIELGKVLAQTWVLSPAIAFELSRCNSIGLLFSRSAYE